MKFFNSINNFDYQLTRSYFHIGIHFYTLNAANILEETVKDFDDVNLLQFIDLNIPVILKNLITEVNETLATHNIETTLLKQFLDL